MDEKLARVHDLLAAARHDLPQTTTDDPALVAAVENLTRAVTWLLDAVEVMNDQRVGR